MTNSHGIRTQEARRCLICDAEGVALYEDMPDRLFEAPGLWSFRQSLTAAWCG